VSDRSEEEEILLNIELIVHVEVLEHVEGLEFVIGSHGHDLLLIVAGPATVTVGTRVVRIIELTGAGVHVAGSLSVKERVASGVFVACSLALLLAYMSPLAKFDTCWCFADTLVVSVHSSWLLLVVARPSTIAISGWVGCIVEFTSTSVHVSRPFSKQERLASGISVAMLLAPSSGLVSPHAKFVTNWCMADALGPRVSGRLSHSNSVEAFPALIAIASWIVHIEKGACSRVHVSLAFGIDK